MLGEEWEKWQWKPPAEDAPSKLRRPRRGRSSRNQVSPTMRTRMWTPLRRRRGSRLSSTSRSATESGGAWEKGAAKHLRTVTARVMERLKPVMQAEDLAEVRTFGFLPAIALSADGALIARLLAMPEVLSIELDRELQPLGDAASELKFD